MSCSSCREGKYRHEKQGNKRRRVEGKMGGNESRKQSGGTIRSQVTGIAMMEK